MPSKVIWPPILQSLASSISESEGLTLALSPFIKSNALRELLDRVTPSNNTSVIVRWRVEDLLSGASDLEIFDILTERDIKLFIHPDIHLKLFQFSSNKAFIGSANITQKGLSLVENHNQETGVLTELEQVDFQEIRRLCDEARLVTPEIVEAYKDAIIKSTPANPVIEKLNLPEEERKAFLLSNLPASENPKTFLSEVNSHKLSAESMHDLYTLKLQTQTNDKNFEELMKKSFKNSPFIKEVVDFIREREFRRFGEIKAFVHDLCEDVPLPYRWEITEFIQRLYPWLLHCFDDFTYDRPNHTEMIRSSLYES